MHPRFLHIAVLMAATIVLSTNAEARKRQHVQVAAIGGQCVPDNDGRQNCLGRQNNALRATPMGRRIRTSPVNGYDMAKTGDVCSHKTGACARVSPSHSGQFQAYVDDLEAHGATVKFMGGYRKGPCANYSLHPCGKALDVCQLSRGRVDGRCHLPSRATMAAIADRHGLFEGGLWCHSDYGHAQVGTTAAPCGKNLYASVGEYQARRRHHRTRVALRH